MPSGAVLMMALPHWRKSSIVDGRLVSKKSAGLQPDLEYYSPRLAASPYQPLIDLRYPSTKHHL